MIRRMIARIPSRSVPTRSRIIRSSIVALTASTINSSCPRYGRGPRMSLDGFSIRPPSLDGLQRSGRIHMKVQLVVVQGKPEGKSIPLHRPRASRSVAGDGLPPPPQQRPRQPRACRVPGGRGRRRDGLRPREPERDGGQRQEVAPPIRSVTLKNGDLVQDRHRSPSPSPSKGAPVSQGRRGGRPPASPPRSTTSAATISTPGWYRRQGSRPTPDTPLRRL